MGPRKRSDASRSRKGASSSSSGSRPAKGVAQVQLSSENQQKLRRLLQNTGRLTAAGVGSEPTASKDPLETQQATRRLLNIYEKLVAEGFSTSQIELAFSALPPFEAALEDVLDWLCLNLPGDELPAKFSSGGVDVSMEGASVRLLAAAKDDHAHVSTPIDFQVQEFSETGIEIKSAPAEDDVQEKEMKAKQADWIRQYVSQLSEDDENSSTSANSDIDLDWEAQAESSVGQGQHGKGGKAMSLDSRAIEIAAEFEAAKRMATDAKKRKDRQKQAVYGKLICKLKQEMAFLGLSEDILSAREIAHASSTSENAVRVDHCQTEKTVTDRDTIDYSHLDLDICGDGGFDKGPVRNVKDKKDKSETTLKTEQSESEDEFLGMFDEENATQDILPTSILDTQNKAKAMAWALQNSEKKQMKTVLNQENKQRYPKAILQQQCQKKGWGVPKYERTSDFSDMYTYSVSIMRPSSGRGKTKVVGGKITYTAPGQYAGSKFVEEAQNVVATWALFSLFSELPLYHIIPELYRGMMLQWHTEGSLEKVNNDELEKNRRAVFIDSLVSSKKQQMNPESESLSVPTSKAVEGQTYFEISIADTRAEVTTSDMNREDAQGKTPFQAIENADLLMKYQAKRKRESYKEKLRSRAHLPIFAAKGKLLHQIQTNPVVVVSGETGSGKTTQVPQYILEELIGTNEGAFCNIICTQPRRLAAISIAERIAVEQDDGPPGSRGSVVGYQVRLDSTFHQRTKLLFCTTGILLRRLAGDRDLTGVSHVIVDEVHERSILGDFMLTVLKDLNERRKSNGVSPLKIILMSATVDASIFSSYFGNCQIVMIQGRCHSVQTIYLEEVYDMLDYQLPLDSPVKLSGSLTSTGKKRQNLMYHGWGDETALDEEEACNPHFHQELYQNYSLRTQKNLRMLNEDVIDFDLIEELIIYIDKTGEEGAVLVFLPGMGEILALVNRLIALRHFSGVSSDWILALHSSISVREQQRAFQIPPTGVRKIVVATNIAETSITIEDVVHVIDCGRHKEMQYDPRRGMSRMEEAWISQANVKQRCGRAGRLRPGYCYALYTKYRFEKLLRPFQLPEMLRVPLVELCLQIKSLSLGNIGAFLEKAIERPKMEAVGSAIETLHEVGALDDKEELTALGIHLAKLPVDVHIGKMILYGAILGCVSPILTIAACLSHKSPFLSSRDQTTAAEKARRTFVDARKSDDKFTSICRGQQSDQLAMAAAYKSWSTVVDKHGARAGYNYCKANFLDTSTLIMLRDLRLQFAVLLADIGFISLQETNSLKTTELDRWVDDAQRPFNCNAHLPKIIKAIMCAGLYPNVAKMEDESIISGHASALTSRAGLASSQKALWTDGRQEVFIHPSSVNHDVTEFQHPFLMYHEKIKTSKVYVRDTTTVSPYTLLLFGGPISVQHQTGQVSVDGWLKMNAPAQTAVLFKELRAALDSFLQELIRNPKALVTSSNEDIVSSTVKLLVGEETQQ